MPVAEIIASLNVKHGLKMPVEEVATRKEQLYFNILPELKAVPEVLEHIESSFGRIPFACRFRQHARVGNGLPQLTEAPEPFRDAGLCRGLSEEQARSRSLPVGRYQIGGCARLMPGLRRYGDGNSSSQCCRDGLGSGAPAERAVAGHLTGTGEQIGKQTRVVQSPGPRFCPKCFALSFLFSEPRKRSSTPVFLSTGSCSRPSRESTSLAEAIFPDTSRTLTCSVRSD